MSAILKMASGVTPSLVTPSFRIFIISFLPLRLDILTSGLSTGILDEGVAVLPAVTPEGVPLDKVDLGACLRVVISAESLLFFV